MRMRIIKSSLLFFLSGLIQFAPSTMIAQWVLTATDSMIYQNAKNDPAKLRQLASIHQGDRLGAKAQNRLGTLAFYNKRPREAQQDFEVTYALYTNRPEAFEAVYYLGVINNDSAKFEEAKNNLTKYVNTNLTDKDLEYWQYLIVRAMSETNDPNFISAAHAFVSTKHSYQDGNAIIQNELARYYLERGDFANTLIEAQDLIDKYPSSNYVHYAEGDILDSDIGLGNINAALDYASKLLSKYGTNNDDAARAQLTIATIYDSKGDIDRARSEYSKVINLHPSVRFRVSAAEFGLMIIDLNQAKEKKDSLAIVNAVTNLKSFVANHPKDHYSPRALACIAEIATENQNFQEALDAYSKIIQFDKELIVDSTISRLSPDLKGLRDLAVQAHTLRGMILRTQLRNPSGALAEFDAVLVSRPNKSDVLLNKAMCLIDLGQKELARSILRKLVSDNTEVKAAATQVLATI